MLPCCRRAIALEIPTFAGMVCGGRECVGVFWHCVVFRLRRILRGVAACNVRFLPSQEWSVGGRGIVGECCLVAGGLSPWRFLLSQEWSVGERNCGSVLALLSATVALLGRINGDGSRQKLNAKLRNKKVFSKYYYLIYI